MRKKRFQSTIEHVALITVVIGALLWMKGWMQRSIQGRIKANADEVGHQFDPDRTDAIHLLTTVTQTIDTQGLSVTSTDSHEIDKSYTPGNKKE